MLDDITVLILAGGAGRRMGGVDKGWLEIDGEPLIKRVHRRLKPQCPHILISANRNIEQYAALGVKVIIDAEFPGDGPLSGIYNALSACTTPWLLTMAVDTPVVPSDYVARFRRHIAPEFDVYVAHDGTRQHPACALLATSLRATLADSLRAGQRRMTAWQQQQSPRLVDFSDIPDACLNINSPEDLAVAREKLRKTP